MKKSAIILSVLLSAASANSGWTPAVRISDRANSFGPRIVANGDTLHVVYWIWNGHAECYYVRSVDGGGSWALPFYLSDTLISSGEDSPEIQICGDTAVAIWYQDISGGGVNIGFRKSINGGGGWNALSYVLPSDNYELRKQSLCLSGSDIFVIFSHRNAELILECTKGTDWGNTWTPPTEIFRAQQSGDFDIAVRYDTIHMVWPGRYIIGDSWETRETVGKLVILKAKTEGFPGPTTSC
jgi:hypothetical protein